MKKWIAAEIVELNIAETSHHGGGHNNGRPGNGHNNGRPGDNWHDNGWHEGMTGGPSNNRPGSTPPGGDSDEEFDDTNEVS